MIQAFGHDAQAIGDNVRVVNKHGLLLEGIVPKLSESASGKVIAKTYAKETLKQATFAEIKDAVVAPAANTITSSVVGNDTSSIEYKMTNKFVGKVADKIANRATLREKFGDNSIGSELDNMFDLLRDMKELYTW